RTRTTRTRCRGIPPLCIASLTISMAIVMTTTARPPTPAPPSAPALGDDELTRLRLAVLRLARRLRQEHAGDLTPSQLSALSCVEREGPLSLRDLAEMERVQPPSISRIVGSLEGEGW